MRQTTRSILYRHPRGPNAPLFFGGPLFSSPENSGAPVKIFLPVTACSRPSPEMIEAAGRSAGIERRLRSHCLHSTTGSTLANGGTSGWHLQKPLGHANMSNTIGYVRMSPEPLRMCGEGDDDTA